jgi:hypothetical protein
MAVPTLEQQIFDTLLNHTCRIRRNIYLPDLSQDLINAVEPFAYWPFDVNYKDYSGNGRHLAVGLGTDPPYRNDFAYNKGAYHFRGGGMGTVSQFALGEAVDMVHLGSGAAFFFFYRVPSIPDDGTTLYFLIGELHSEGGGSWNVHAMAEPGQPGKFKIAFTLTGNLSTVHYLNEPVSGLLDVSESIWRSFALVHDGYGTLSLYNDGVLFGSTIDLVGPYLLDPFAFNRLVIGADGLAPPYNYPHEGGIDELVTYEDFIVDAQVATLHAMPSRASNGTPVPSRVEIMPPMTEAGLACHFSGHLISGGIGSSRETFRKIESHRLFQQVIVPFDTDVMEQDEVVDLTNGRVYDVEGVEDAGGQEQHKRVFLREMSQGAAFIG